MIIKYTAYCLFLVLSIFSILPKPVYSTTVDSIFSKKQVQETKKTTFVSITPTRAEPGELVILTYTGEIRGSKILLGGDEVAFQVMEGNKISFTLPNEYMPGQYALTLKADNGTSRSYAFTVLPLKPIITRIRPNTINTCDINELKDVIIHGKNFLESSQVIFDGTTISSSFISSKQLRFIIPKVAGGLHQVSVKNANEVTIPTAFQIISAPAISSVTIGENRVSSYDLVIEGANFQQNSVVIANGAQISTSTDMQAGGQLTYIDCNKIVYQRRPYSSDSQVLRIQVINPAGEISRIFVISAP
jgi:hypothetical protein